LEAPIKRAIVLIAPNLLLRNVQIFKCDERKSPQYPEAIEFRSSGWEPLFLLEKNHLFPLSNHCNQVKDNNRKKNNHTFHIVSSGTKHLAESTNRR
jgi:hypothetical protein